MGAIAYGRKLREDAAAVACSFGITPQDPEGVLVIPLHDLDAWYVEGQDRTPFEASRVFAKAVRLRGATGRWPDEAMFFS